jgi:hypothetical protein
MKLLQTLGKTIMKQAMWKNAWQIVSEWRWRTNNC